MYFHKFEGKTRVYNFLVQSFFFSKMSFLTLSLIWISERLLKWYSFPSKTHSLRKNCYPNWIGKHSSWEMVDQAITENMLILGLNEKNNVEIHLNNLWNVRKVFLLILVYEKISLRKDQNSRIKTSMRFSSGFVSIVIWVKWYYWKFRVF